jgi:hypothetical protein
MSDDPFDNVVEVIHEDGDGAVAGVLRLFLDGDRMILGELPTSWVSWGAKEESPRSRAYHAFCGLEVPHVEYREQGEGHRGARSDGTLRCAVPRRRWRPGRRPARRLRLTVPDAPTSWSCVRDDPGQSEEATARRIASVTAWS